MGAVQENVSNRTAILDTIEVLMLCISILRGIRFMYVREADSTPNSLTARRRYSGAEKLVILIPAATNLDPPLLTGSKAQKA